MAGAIGLKSMASLYSLTDTGYVEPQQAALPAEIPPELKRVYITGEEPVKDKGYTDEEYFTKPYKPLPELPSSNIIEKLIKTLGESEFSKGHPLGNQLFGTGGEERYQLWPERMLREGLTAAGEIAQGKVPTWSIDKTTGDVHTSPQMIEKAQEISALAGTGGLAGAGGSLNATPSLRPALKYKDKLYKGKEGQQHLDVIPADLYPTFQKQAMSGEDISNFNFGFINDKGHFLSREDALKYGIDNGLIDPHAGKYGALTSTMELGAKSNISDFVPAIKVKNKIYQDGAKGDHPSIEAKNKLQGMSQEDGFVDSNGNFLNRQQFEDKFNVRESDHLKIKQGLTTQLLADSSKPGMAIEAKKDLPSGYELKPVDYTPEFKTELKT